MALTGEADRSLRDIAGKSLLRVGEAAEVLSVSRWTIYRWVEEGRLKGTRIGKGSMRIFRESIVGLIEAHQTQLADSSPRAHHS